MDVEKEHTVSMLTGLRKELNISIYLCWCLPVSVPVFWHLTCAKVYLYYCFLIFGAGVKLFFV